MNSEWICTNSKIHEAVGKLKPVLAIHEPAWNVDACVIDHIHKPPHLRSRVLLIFRFLIIDQHLLYSLCGYKKKLVIY